MSDSFAPGGGRTQAGFPGVPDQGLLTCELCRAINLPNSYFCCQCGEPIAGGPLDAAARREVEELLRSAIALDPTAPVFVTDAGTFNSRSTLENVSLWPAALASREFVNDPWQGQAVLRYARVVVTDAAQSTVNDWLPLLESVCKASQALLVVAGGYGNEVLATLAVNKRQGVLNCAALLLTPPAETHALLLQDIARVLRTSVVTARGLARPDIDSLPVVQEVRANSAHTLACGVAAVAPPALQGDPTQVALRKGIYGRQAVRVAVGANSRASIQARIRYAARLLPTLSPSAGMTSQALPAGITTRAP